MIISAMFYIQQIHKVDKQNIFLKLSYTPLLVLPSENKIIFSALSGEPAQHPFEHMEKV